MTNLNQKTIDYYNNDKATKFMVSCSRKLMTEIFDNIEAAVEYAVTWLPESEYIDEDTGEIKNEHLYGCELATEIYNDVEHEEFFNDYYASLND